MVTVPKKVADRLAKEVRVFQRVLEDARKRDVNESDTVMIITDMLERVFGFDKYLEVTTEQAIRGTYCDLAVKLDDSVQYLIEVKAIGIDLKENHMRQALNYGLNHGIPWVVLTNGVDWEVYRVKFERPVEHEQVCTWNFLELNPRKADDQRMLFLLCRGGLRKAAIEQYHEHVQTVNRHAISAVIQSEPVLAVIRRELRRMSPGAKVSLDEISALLPEVLKREVLEGKGVANARRRLTRAANTALRKKAKRASAKANAGASPGLR